MTSAGAALDVQGLSKVYAAEHGLAGGVRDASFTLKPGAFFSLLGPSGCGKTTTLRCIAGLEQPDQGMIRLGETVFFDAASGVSVPLNRRRIGMVFQSYAIWPHMTVSENVAFPLRVAKDPRHDHAETRRLVDEALDTVNLSGLQGRPATKLSGGQQQRVALARAIVRKPGLLLLDEPLSNLDAALREEMRTELKRLQQQIGITTIYVTHDQAEALEMSDLVAVIDAGRVMQLGPPREIYFRPRNAFVAGFVGATNLVQGVTATAAIVDALVPVTVADGQSLRCLFPYAAEAGQSIAVSIRPETIDLALAATPAPEGCNRLSGTVVNVGFLGNMNRYTIRAGNALMQANTAPDVDFAVGCEVAMLFPFERTIAVPS